MDFEVREILADVFLLVRGQVARMHPLLDRTEILVSKSVVGMV